MRGGDARGASLKPHDLFNDRDDFNRIENFLNATRVASVVQQKHGIAINMCGDILLHMSDYNFPPAYFITFTCYGNWVHSDARGSVNPNLNEFATPRITPNKEFENLMRDKLRYDPFLLNETRRESVLQGIIHACNYYHWRLYAAHVRTNHLHILLHAREKSDTVTTKIKALATKFLKKRHNDLPEQKFWTRGKSARCIWDFAFLSLIRDYIIEEQGEKMAHYSDPMFMREDEFHYDF
ncbi:MAG: transposase [Gammaproteobacteria bacterium]|nr:transposase [Gammaproteobacteria bacterium]